MGNNKKEKKHKKGLLGTVSRSIKVLVFLTLILIGAALYFRYGRDVIALYEDARYLVSRANADTFCQSETSIVYDAYGEEITTLSGEKDLYYIEYENIPRYFIDAMVSVEDRKFFEHEGVDMKGITRAAISLFTHNGEITQGGSTITQQLARNIFLTNQVTWERKVEEVFIALELEEKYSKEEIMEFYLNNIYFGNGYYGIQAAAQGYFSKEATDLTLSEVAFLCAIPNNPTYYDPLEYKEHTVERRDKILSDMLEEEYINSLEYQMASAEEIILNLSENHKNDYVETYVFYCATRALMEADGFAFQTVFESEMQQEAYEELYQETYRNYQQTLFTGGYRIYTSIDMEKQALLQESLDDVLEFSDETNETGIYALQGAATCMDNETGRVVAIVGGRSQEVEGYTLNRAYQSPRQPGSAIKPLNVYTPALEWGYTPDTIVEDTPIENGPVNASTYEGEITLTEAVKKSKNVVAYRIYQELTPMVAMQYILNMDFQYLTIEDRTIMAGALGGFAYGVTTEEMAGAYCALANEGVYRRADCIVAITDAKGTVLVENTPKEKQVYQKKAAEEMTEMLEQVFDGGTADGMGLKDMHCAGKTGTTNNHYDGWFCGYTPYYTTAVWVGYDNPEKLSSLSGNTYPLYIWKAYMEDIHEDLEDTAFGT